MPLPDPETRKERYLYKIAGGDGDIPDDPYTREEIYLEAIAEGITEVIANPTLVGTESDLTGLQVGDTKYKIPEELPDTTGASAGDVLTIGSDGLEWATPSAGMSNPMTAAGDLIVGGTSGTPTRLAKGTNDKVLKMVNGSPTWGDAAGKQLYLHTILYSYNVTDIISARFIIISDSATPYDISSLITYLYLTVGMGYLLPATGVIKTSGNTRALVGVGGGTGTYLLRFSYLDGNSPSLTSNCDLNSVVGTVTDDVIAL